MFWHIACSLWHSTLLPWQDVEHLMVACKVTASPSSTSPLSYSEVQSVFGLLQLQSNIFWEVFFSEIFLKAGNLYPLPSLSLSRVDFFRMFGLIFCVVFLKYINCCSLLFLYDFIFYSLCCQNAFFCCMKHILPPIFPLSFITVNSLLHCDFVGSVIA